MNNSRVIALEFNELCPQLMAKFMADGSLPNFRRLHEQSQVFTTVADEVAPLLDPWIQWITVHSGVPYKEHGIRDLGDGYRFAEKNVWDLVSEAGGSVWVCGSMNLNYRSPINGWVVPDPWCQKVPPTPAELAPYYRFVSANVTEYTSNKVPLTKWEQARFVGFMARHGLRLETATVIARQLADERMGKKVYWKRAAILDRIQFDLFRHRFQRARPDFSTFFLNSTAHFQHLYWRNMEPERFTIKPSQDEQSVYQDAVRFGYQGMDRIVGETMELAGEGTTIVFCTAFSQQPFLAYEDRGGKTPYRPIDFAAFQRAIGIASPGRASPVMTHQFHLEFDSEAEAAQAAEQLRALRWDGRTVMAVDLDGKKIFTGCHIYGKVPSGATIEQGDRRLGFFDLLYHIDLVKSGMHHPDGMLWIRTPARNHEVHDDKVPLVDVAPTLVELLGLPQPASMKGRPLALHARARAA